MTESVSSFLAEASSASPAIGAPRGRGGRGIRRGGGVGAQTPIVANRDGMPNDAAYAVVNNNHRGRGRGGCGRGGANNVGNRGGSVVVVGAMQSTAPASAHLSASAPVFTPMTPVVLPSASSASSSSSVAGNNINANVPIAPRGRGNRRGARGRVQSNNTISVSASSSSSSATVVDSAALLLNDANAAVASANFNRRNNRRGRGGNNNNNNNNNINVNNVRMLASSIDSISSDDSTLSSSSSSSVKKKIRRVKRAPPASEVSKLESGGYSSLSAQMIATLQADCYECLICFERVKRHHAIWSCRQCYGLFHIGCVADWSRRSFASADALKDSHQWRCPACQFAYNKTPVSACLCGKNASPAADDRYLVPHSCGEPCGRPRNLGYTHKCPMLCHPGACGPCQAPGPLESCYCGETDVRLRCTDLHPSASSSLSVNNESKIVLKNARSCGGVCQQPLSCNVHRCTQICHPPPCPPCTETFRRRCFCGRTIDNHQRCGSEQFASAHVWNDKTLEKSITPTTLQQQSTTTTASTSDIDTTSTIDNIDDLQRTFACNEICGDLLDCGQHRCAEKCHTGPCESCALSPQRVKTCPCGAVLIGVDVNDDSKTSSISTVDVLSNNAIANNASNSNVESDSNAVGVVVWSSEEQTRLEAALLRHTGSLADKERWRKVAADVDTKTAAECVQRFRDCARQSQPQQLQPALSAAVLAVRKTVRKFCTDLVPCCDNVCGHALPGCAHKCKQRCHIGVCPPCTELVIVRCRCGATTAKRQCNIVTAHEAVIGDGLRAPLLLCNKICHAEKQCGRHSCNERCCAGDYDADVHICRKKCNKGLSCGKHKCPQLCHKGPCQVCLNASFEEFRCACGGTVVLPPISCGAVLPVCQLPCKKVRPCGHQNAIGHLCHSGACPPCTELCSRKCDGGHSTVIYTACHVTTVLCGRVCEKLLSCERHRCDRRCHKGACQELSDMQKLTTTTTTDEASVSKQLIACHRTCLIPRTSCTHGCQSLCHPLTACPDVPCTVVDDVFCACGRRSVKRMCGRGGAIDIVSNSDSTALNNDDSINNSTTTLSTTTIATTTTDEKVDTDGWLKTNDDDDNENNNDSIDNKQSTSTLTTTSKTNSNIAFVLACDAVCEAEQRKKTLADAFGFVGKDGKPPPYTQDLLHFALASPQFTRDVERALQHVATSGEVAVGGSYRLPPMDSMRRQIVHKLAKYWMVPTASVGEEPQRRVVLARAADSKAPTMTLMQSVSQSGSKGLAALHFYNLTPHVRTSHMLDLLKPFDGLYRFKWLDDCNAIASFVSESEAKLALRMLKEKNAPYDVTIFDDAQASLFGVLSTTMPSTTSISTTTSDLLSLSNDVQENVQVSTLNQSMSVSSDTNEQARRALASAQAALSAADGGGWSAIVSGKKKSVLNAAAAPFEWKD